MFSNRISPGFRGPSFRGFCADACTAATASCMAGAFPFRFQKLMLTAVLDSGAASRAGARCLLENVDKVNLIMLLADLVTVIIIGIQLAERQ